MEGILGEMIPIFFMLVIAVLVIGPTYIRARFAAREREALHATVRAAIEKGQPVPVELMNSLQSAAQTPPPVPTRERDLRAGIICICAGIGIEIIAYGLWFGLSATDDTAAYIAGGAVAGGGAIPGLIGVGFLLLWYLRRKND